MKHRFTIKELDTWSDTEILTTLINERVYELNPYAPLASRLSSVRSNLSDRTAYGVSVAKVNITEMYQVSILADISKYVDFSEEDLNYIETKGDVAEHYQHILHEHGYLLHETSDWWYIIGVLIDE